MFYFLTIYSFEELSIFTISKYRKATEEGYSAEILNN
jgi:hypothetical protein